MDPAHNPPSKTPQKGNLYLAGNVLGNTLQYALRISYFDGINDCFCHRELFDLGDDPEQFIINIGDNGYYISEVLVDAVEEYVEGEADALLEKLLWPFVDHAIRTKLKPFMNRAYTKPLTPVSRDEQDRIEREIHIFDRRRLHFLWYGSIDQTGLFKMPDKLCRKLLGKSRDEKEQYFSRKEQVLYAEDLKIYLFTIFNLQQYFTESFARIMPEALDRDRIDAYFIKELCRLDRDMVFWQGMEPADCLHSYLVRYLIMFFDYEFGPSSALDDYIRQFMNSRRQFHFPNKKVKMDEAAEIFGVPAEKLHKLNKKELTKLYRMKAKELHPDTPDGEHDQFVKLTETYEGLMRSKR